MSRRRIDDAAMEALLAEWGRTHGGSRYEHIGYPSRSTIATAVEHHGFRPDAQTAKLCVRLDSPADQVESLVIAMHRQGIDGEADAHCLRVTYDASLPDERARLRRLHAIGWRVGNNILRDIRRQRFYERAHRARSAIALLLGAARVAA